MQWVSGDPRIITRQRFCLICRKETTESDEADHYHGAYLADFVMSTMQLDWVKPQYIPGLLIGSSELVIQYGSRPNMADIYTRCIT